MANPNDLKRALYGDKDLHYADLSGANLIDAKLSRADLVGADLKDAKLSGADLDGAYLNHAELIGADLSHTTLTGARLRDAYLTGAYLIDAKLIDANFSDANLSKADLRGADFWGAILTNAILKDAGLEGAKLDDADLTGADLTGAKLKGADLTGAKGIPLSISDKFLHKGETVEEKARRETIQDVTKRVSRAKKDKELEALAQEVGSLQAQPDYVKEYKKVLEDLQAEIEEKYSVLGKGLNYLKKLFSRGKRASQIRVASEMNREIQREIKALKRDLDK